MRLTAIKDDNNGSTVHWAAKFETPFYAYEAKDVCKYSNVVKSSKPKKKVQNLQQLTVENSTTLRTKTPTNFPLPPPPLDSSEYERLTENELRWISSLREYGTAQV